MDRINAAQDKSTAHLACDLSAISSDERLRYHKLRALLCAALISWREFGGGYALRLNDERISRQEVSEWIKMERVCCPWLSIETEQAPRGALKVRIIGPAEAKQVLRAEFAELLERTISKDEVSR